MRKNLFVGMALLALAAVSIPLTPTLAPAEDWKDRFEFSLAPDFRMDGYTLVYNPNKDLDLYRDIEPVNLDGSINVVVEIPQGDNRKFETFPDTGKIGWEFKNGKPRFIKYLGYPGNYGMLPRTLGGDGDPLDVLTLGKTDLRGAVSEAKVIGVLYLVDGGDRDEKLIAVLPGTPLYGVNSIAELNAKFAGVTTIIETWFTSYKGPGEIFSTGFGGPEEAWAVINAGLADFR